MNIVFMGTPDFAVPCLNALIDNNYNIKAVISQPDRPKGRGNKLTLPPVKMLAVGHNIPVYQPEKVRDQGFINQLKEINPDLIIVVAFGQILPKDILELPKYGCINVHGSLLPKYRGAAPIQWSVINSDNVTGVTTMYMDVGLDTGDMILKSEVTIEPEDTAEDVFNKLSALGANLLIDTIKAVESGQAPRIPQDNSEATYAQMLSKELGNIDWNKSSKEIKDLVRGTYPWPGAYTYYKGTKMKIFRLEILSGNTSAKPGMIIDVTKDAVLVQTGSGIVSLKEIQTEGGKRMSIREYLVGHVIDKNEILCGEADECTS